MIKTFLKENWIGILCCFIMLIAGFISQLFLQIIIIVFGIFIIATIIVAYNKMVKEDQKK